MGRREGKLALVFFYRAKVYHKNWVWGNRELRRFVGSVPCFLSCLPVIEQGVPGLSNLVGRTQTCGQKGKALGDSLWIHRRCSQGTGSCS